ncbi:MAG: phage holin family protein [Cellulomonadaceae bacterium]
MIIPAPPSGTDTPPPNAPEPSIGELFGRITEQTSRLVRAEIELAKKELVGKATKLGVGIGLVAVGGVLALYGLGVLIHAAVLGLSTVLAPWLAALIVGLAIFLVVGVLVLVGVKQLKAGSPPTPEAALESIKKDVDTVKKGLSS